MQHIVDFEPVGRRVPVEDGKTILEAARGLDFFGGEGMSAPCGGKGLCGRCRVRVRSGELSPPSSNETRLLDSGEMEQGYRLACQAVVRGPVKVEIPPDVLAGHQALQLDGRDAAVIPEPLVKRCTVRLEATTIQCPRTVWKQVADALARDYGLQGIAPDLELLRRGPALAADGEATVTVRGNEVINAYFTVPAQRSVGLAVDLGTTKVAAFLVDLESGETLAREGLLNPQITFGEDVMSRLMYALQGEGHCRELSGAVVEGLNLLLGELARRAGVTPGAVEDAVIAGNTAMHHLLLRLPVDRLARAPYVPVSVLPVEVKGRELGLNMAPGGFVYMVPPVAGFVGGDHVAMILGSGIDRESRAALGLDIGTNTEIVLAREGEMTCCSCASGPAFEGAHIKYGMRAVDGAISKVWLSPGGRDVYYETIGGRPPAGICGSGVLDAVAALYGQGVINEAGRLDRGHPRVRPGGEKKVPEFLLAAGGESGVDHDLALTQHDIGEIQLAKAAIAAGTRLLLREAGLGREEIKKVVVAGAFGTHLRVESAVAIGMLPDLPRDRFCQVGNAAGAGARQILLSRSLRGRGEAIAGRVKYLELTSVPAFSEEYVNALGFPV